MPFKKFVYNSNSKVQTVKLSKAELETLVEAADKIVSINDSFAGCRVAGDLYLQAEKWQDALDCYERLPQPENHLRIGEVYSIWQKVMWDDGVWYDPTGAEMRFSDSLILMAYDSFQRSGLSEAESKDMIREVQTQTVNHSSYYVLSGRHASDTDAKYEGNPVKHKKRHEERFEEREIRLAHRLLDGF